MQAPKLTVPPFPQVGQLLPPDPVQQTVRPHIVPIVLPEVQLQLALGPFTHPLEGHPWAVHPVLQVVKAVQPALQVASAALGPVLQVNPTPTGTWPVSAKSTNTGGSYRYGAGTHKGMTIKLKYLSDYAVGSYSSRWGVIRKRGATLSVGQRQRISLARAFLRDALILILDEFTSALDAGTERTVRASLRDLRKGKTAIIISHHPQVLADTDRVILLEKGRITAEGRYGELEETGCYRGTMGFPDSGEA